MRSEFGENSEVRLLTCRDVFTTAITNYRSYLGKILASQKLFWLDDYGPLARMSKAFSMQSGIAS